MIGFTAPEPSRVEQLRAEYSALLHAMQSGVAADQGMTGAADATPKHLRVGINAAMTDHAALVSLLMSKGLITEEEYYGAMVASMRAEVQRYEADLSKRLGKVVRLV